MCSSGGRPLTGTCEGDLSKVITFQEFRPRRCISSIHARLGPSHEGYLPFLDVGHPLAPALLFSKAPTARKQQAATGLDPRSLDLQGGHRGSCKSLAKTTRLAAESRSSPRVYCLPGYRRQKVPFKGQISLLFRRRHHRRLNLFGRSRSFWLLRHFRSHPRPLRGIEHTIPLTPHPVSRHL